MDKSGVSVIVCCYNSADRLPKTLMYLALQVVPEAINWEIIIVNNASTDDTSLTATKEWAKYKTLGVNFKVIDQPIAGLSNAKEKGLMSAEYEYILFCDDDNWLFHDYISTAFAIINSDPNIGILGGCGLFEPEEPIWPDIQKFEISYVNGSQTWTATDHWVYGAGSVYRKSVLISFYNIGWKQITSGRTGSKLISGEDVETCFMYFLSGFKVISDDRLLFKHFVPLRRQNIGYILNLHFWQSYSNVLLSGYVMLINKDPQNIQKKIDIWFIHLMKALMVHIGEIIYQKLIKQQPINNDQIITLQSYYGAIFSILKNRKKIINHDKCLKSILNRYTPNLVNVL